MNSLVIGDKIAKLPIIQGGMGVGVSLSNLAGAVAHEGGVGIISTAQIGFDEPDFLNNTKEANLRAIKKHIAIAKEKAINGLVGVNVMVALKDFEEHVRTAAKAGADIIISGAGLPMKLPELVEGTKAKIAPIVSSSRAANLILKMWKKKYNRTADLVVIEGPKAGGHLGFTSEEIEEDVNGKLNYDEEIFAIAEVIKEYEKDFDTKIPFVVGGGIYTREDVKHAFELGAQGVQVGSRFVATKECDASDLYKQAYINASKEDVKIIKSPVGLPGRAIKNKFLEKVKNEKCKVTRCLGCLAKCNPSEIPYCITDALIKAVKGDVENGLLFCGSNVYRIDKITTVKEVIAELLD